MQELVNILRSIDQKLTELLHIATHAEKPATPVPEVADSADLDGQWGNPAVRFTPYGWTGPSMVGRAFSDCPPEFLDRLATSFDAFARKNTREGRPKQAWLNRKDAARARGWAQRARTPIVAPPLPFQPPTPPAAPVSAPVCRPTFGYSVEDFGGFCGRGMYESNDHADDAEYHRYLYETGQMDPF